jgi:Family of unknown function (DUF6152)
MRALQRILLLSAAIMVGSSSWAHHSFAMFDLDKEMTLEGVVKEFQWTNPHVWLQILVPDPKEGTLEWSLEAGAPGMLTRTGWKSSMLKANDKVTVVIHPLKSGAPGGSLVRVTLPSGRVMGPGGPASPAPAKPAA